MLGVRAFRRTVELVIGYLLIFGGLAIAAPAALVVILGLMIGGVSTQILTLAGGLALTALGLAFVLIVDRGVPV